MRLFELRMEPSLIASVQPKMKACIQSIQGFQQRRNDKEGQRLKVMLMIRLIRRFNNSGTAS